MRFLSPVIGLLSLLPVLFTGGPASAASGQQDEIIEHANEPWSGDLDGITERRFLRILTVHNPLFFSFNGAKQKGMVAELAQNVRGSPRRRDRSCTVAHRRRDSRGAR